MLAITGKSKLPALLLDRGADVNGKTIGGWTPLHAAAGMGQLEIVALLLDRGADVNGKNNEGWTPLHLYCLDRTRRRCHVLLLDRGAEVNGKTNYEWTPLRYATKCGHADVVALLLERGAKETENEKN